MKTTEKETAASPSLGTMSPGNGRLIDEGLIHFEASMAGLAERYARGETSHTIHVWWARRPHTAMRALVFASLSKSVDENSFDLLSRLCADTGSEERVLEKAREQLRREYRGAPTVLDMFGGGGTIGLEALRLGAKAVSIDANELAVFLQKSNLVYSQSLDTGDRIALLEDSGTRVLRQLERDTAEIFPLRSSAAFDETESVSGYLWSYSFKCSCGFRYLLSKRPWLSKKRNRNLALVIRSDAAQQTVCIEQVPEDHEQPLVWNGKARITICPKCSRENEIGVQLCQDELLVEITSKRGDGKEFALARKDACPPSAVLEALEAKTLRSLKMPLPTSVLPAWSGIVNPALYGINTHAEFLNRRQRVVLLLLIKALRDEYQRLLKARGDVAARFTIGSLSSLVDQLIDWNCRLSMWIPQNEQTGRAFCGPGIAMLWDYVETDPVGSGPGNLWSKLKRTIAGVASIGKLPESADIRHAVAQKLPFEAESFDAIVTDPPYYDNLYYSVLADFFYAWKRMLFRDIVPELFKPVSCSSADELVASAHRSGGADQAHQDYCGQLALAVSEASRVLKTSGVFTFVYSHSSVRGWEAMVRAFRSSFLIISSVQPLSIERRQRPRAMTSEAVNTCIAFVARKSKRQKRGMRPKELLDGLRGVLKGTFADGLLEAGWNPADVALAVYAHGVAMLANVGNLVGDSTDSDVLVLMESVVQERFADFRIQKRGAI